MSMNDPIGDLLSRIRNAQMRKKSKVSTPGSRLRANLLDVLKTEGYIRGYTTVEHKDGRSEFEIELKYFDGAPVIREIERMSKPGRRVYVSVKTLPRVNNGLGISILSTPKGVMADHDAREAECRRRNPLHRVLGPGKRNKTMSRIGKKPVPIPSGVTANVEGQTVKVKGPKGQLQVVLPDDVMVKMDNGEVKVDPRNETKRARSMWGTSRTLVNNLVTGVTKGYERKLEITGVGYRAALQGKNLQIALGYSHDVIFPIPEGIAIATPKPTEILITGIDKQKVGQVAAEIRSFRPPEPYKGKGVKYANEYIFRKEGKKK